MQFNDIFFSTDKILKPGIISFIVGLFTLMLLSYISTKYSIEQKIISKLVFTVMLVVFFIIRYIQAKKAMEEYKKKKRDKIKRREAREAENINF